jgi:Fe-S cluster biosynthesis and repair protein YggX
MKACSFSESACDDVDAHAALVTGCILRSRRHRKGVPIYWCVRVISCTQPSKTQQQAILSLSLKTPAGSIPGQQRHHILHADLVDPVPMPGRRDHGAVGPFRIVLAHQGNHRHVHHVRQVHHGRFHRDDQFTQAQYGRQLEEIIFRAAVSKKAWQGWLKHQTMLINENRLNMANARARKYLATQMERHFFGEDADQAMGYVPSTA